MLLFARRYLGALLCLLVAMGGYSLFLVPAIEPPPRRSTELPEYSGALGGEQWWENLFSENTWQCDQPQILQSKRGMVLLSKSWAQIGPKTLELKPLTMILPQSNLHNLEGGPHAEKALLNSVIIINAEQGAVIHFEQPIDPSGAIPSVERGHLHGKIEIIRQVAGRANEPSWSVRTSELSIDRNRVSTQQEVTIEWPDGVIRGHDMKLTLQGDLLGSAGNHSSPWGPLRSLDLYHIDQIDMALSPGGLWGNSAIPRPPSLLDLSSLPARLRMACGGRFSFDFTRSRATLVSGVHVVHQLADLPADEFSSQELVIDLAAPNRVGPPSDSAAPNLAGIQLKQLEATGVDSLENFIGEQKVEIKSPLLGAFASAKRLRLDFLENRFELDGKLSHPGATQSTALLEYMGYQFTAPRIDYDADGKGVHHAAEHLGYLVASGAGELRVPADSKIGTALVRWHDSLEMRPTETDGLQWVGLFGNVLIESFTYGFMACDDLEIWLKKNQAPPVTHHAGSNAETEEAHYLPDRLRSIGKTIMSAQQIKADVEKLTVSFNFLPTPASNTADASSLALSDSAGRPMYQWLQPPESTNGSPELPLLPPSTSVGVAANTTASATSIHVRGREMDATLLSVGKQSWLDNLIVNGPLEVTGSSTTADLATWTLMGDQLQMATNPSGQIDMQITGRPARIALADGSLQGPTIRFDQKSNLMWMDQPGEFTLPTKLLANKPPTGATMDWFKPPRCQWQGQMLFDGKTVHIDGNIRFDGAVRLERDQFWWISGQSDSLRLDLSQPVDFGEIQPTEVQPHSVTLSNNVNILAWQKDQLGNKKNRQHLQLPSLTFDIRSNEIVGLGPGSIHSWHLTQGGLGHMASRETGSQKLNLQGAHLVFRDSLRGFLDRSEIYVQGKIELVSGPLATWDDAIDLGNMRQLSIGQMHLDCDLLKLYDTSSLSSTASLKSDRGARHGGNWEFQAKGNVNFAGKSEAGDYEGNGSEVTYVQAKELLLLQGQPKRPATIISKPISKPLNLSTQGILNLSVAYAAINPRTLAIERWELGENGVRFDVTGSDAAPNQQPIPQSPVRAPNPRGTVSDFLQRK